MEAARQDHSSTTCAQTPTIAENTTTVAKPAQYLLTATPRRSIRANSLQSRLLHPARKYTPTFGLRSNKMKKNNRALLAAGGFVLVLSIFGCNSGSTTQTPGNVSGSSPGVKATDIADRSVGGDSSSPVPPVG